MQGTRQPLLRGSRRSRTKARSVPLPSVDPPFFAVVVPLEFDEPDDKENDADGRRRAEAGARAARTQAAGAGRRGPAGLGRNAQRFVIS